MREELSTVTGHVFTDESKRRDFVLVAGAVLPDSLASARQQIQSLYLPGQRGIHMVKERAGRQRSILRAIAALEVEVTVYLAVKGRYKTERIARQRCIEELVTDIASRGHSHLCIERDDSTAADDRRTISRQLQQVGYRNQLSYSHNKVASEPLLVIPDAIAWAWPQRNWRKECASVVKQVREL